ncbi:uncharacterized protein LOC119549320 [Drosophila subpulchrella]|uniref:uncharacterized protein LOC119549320 n=1 Tax=Drosophila subpulchrella TaxID=1486046 RepID=UPI0018A131D9|nr:uncharacterized protein LOC119549320 [Drosophila subpulchrella]
MNAESDLLSLPDDALILILCYLELPIQLRLTQVHPRFLEVMPHVWRSCNKSLNLSLIELHLSDKDLRFFLESTQRSLNALRLRMEKQSNFDIFTDYVFPNLKDFRFSTHSFSLSDSDLPKMINSLPNLTTFSPHGKFTGKHLVDFQFLENLTLSYCSKMKVVHLIDILRARSLKILKLAIFDINDTQSIELPWEGIKNLELLQGYSWELERWFFTKLEHLKHLKQIILCDHDDEGFLEKVLMSAKRSSIKMLEINAGMPLFYVIKKLNVPCKIMKVAGYHLYLYDGCFENITELYLKNCHFPKEAILEIIMQQMKACEILGLECCQFGFKHFTFVALEIGFGRCSKLNVYLSENIYQSNNFMDNDMEMKWIVEGEHKFFQLHMDHPKITSYSHPLSIYFD